MSRASVRQAIADYLTASNVTGLGSAIPYPEKVTPEGDFIGTQPPGTAGGAVVYVHFDEQSERRIGLGGPLDSAAPGLKMRQYLVVLICVYHSMKPSAAQVGADNDAFLDSLVAAIQSNRNAGSPGTVFQWGEGDDLGGPDVEVRSEMPRQLRNQMTQVFSTVHVTALELVRS